MDGSGSLKEELRNNTSRQPYIQTQSKQVRGIIEGRRNEPFIFYRDPSAWT